LLGSNGLVGVEEFLLASGLDLEAQDVEGGHGVPRRFRKCAASGIATAGQAFAHPVAQFLEFRHQFIAGRLRRFAQGTHSNKDVIPLLDNRSAHDGRMCGMLRGRKRPNTHGRAIFNDELR
jgi:hypothetical protein